MNRVVSLLLILLFVFSCDNEEDAINEVEEDEPAITEIGEPTGSAVTKEIGPGGGIVSSADGKLDVSVPAGLLQLTLYLAFNLLQTSAPADAMLTDCFRMD